jgi:hypothetical protein
MSRTRPAPIDPELLPSLVPNNRAGARWMLAWLLRAVRVSLPDGTEADRRRRRDFGSELAGVLPALAVTTQSPLEFFFKLCGRWDADPVGSSDGYTLEAWTPRGAIPWYLAVSRLTIEHVRAVVQENPHLLGQFAVKWNETDAEDLEDDALLASLATTTPEESRPTLAALVPKGDAIAPREYFSLWTATGPCHHGADSKQGNFAAFRRAPAIDFVTGETVEVPFLSGNSVRGAWRDLAMKRTCELLGLDPRTLAPNVSQSLFAGGTIESGADTAKIDNRLRRRLRDLLPAWDLFGGNMSGQMMAGRLRVSDAVLVCKQNAWTVSRVACPGMPLAEVRDALKDAVELMAIRQLTRRDHPEYRGEDTESGSMQMITQTEVVIRDAQWVHRFSLYGNEGVAPLTQSCMADLLEEFAAIGGWLGASGARGFGSVLVHGYQARELPALASSDLYADHVEKHKDELVALLGECAKGAGGSDPEAKSKPASKGVKKATKAAQQSLEGQEST